MADNPQAKRRRGRGGARVGFRKATSEEPAPEPEEPELTEEEYEKQKRILLRRAVLCEKQYIELRTTLRDNKARELAEYRKAVEEKRCPEYLREKEKAEKELKKKNDINCTRHELKSAQIMDEFNAEMEMNETQFDDQLTYAQNRYIDFFENLIKEKKKRQREAGMILGALLTLPPIPNEVTAQPVYTDVVYDGRITRSRSRSQKPEDRPERPEDGT